MEVCFTADNEGFSGNCGARVTYHDPATAPSLSAVAPAFVPVSERGNNRTSESVLVSGSNFAPTSSLECLTRPLSSPEKSAVSLSRSAASFVSGTAVRCKVPSTPHYRQLMLSVSKDGRLWSDEPLELTFFKKMQVKSVTPQVRHRRRAAAVSPARPHDRKHACMHILMGPGLHSTLPCSER